MAATLGVTSIQYPGGGDAAFYQEWWNRIAHLPDRYCGWLSGDETSWGNTTS